MSVLRAQVGKAAVLVGLLLGASAQRSHAQLIPGMPSQLPPGPWGGLPIPAGIPTAPPSGPGLAPLYARGLDFMDPARYLKLVEAFAPSMGSLTGTVDLSADFPPPGNQGQQGSCVAWAVGYGLKSFQEHEERGWAYTKDHLFSPAYVYNSFKSGKCSGGLYVGDTLDFVAANGIAPLSMMPYSATDCATKPTDEAKAAAKAFRVHSVRRVPNNSVEIKGHIAARMPVVVGMRLDSSFDYLKPGQVYQGMTGPSIGGHAMVIVGYDDNRQAFKVLNSWGTDWADKGFGWISYAAIAKQADELYVARDFSAEPSPNPTPTPTPGPNPAPKPVAAEPKATLGAVSTMQNILVGDSYYFGLAVAGALKDAQGRKYQLVVRFRRGGQPIPCKDSRYADGYGHLAAGTPKQIVPSANFNLGAAPSIAIPQLTLRQSLGAVSGETVELEVFYDAYVETFFVGRSQPTKMKFRWN